MDSNPSTSLRLFVDTASHPLSASVLIMREAGILAIVLRVHAELWPTAKMFTAVGLPCESARRIYNTAWTISALRT